MYGPGHFLQLCENENVNLHIFYVACTKFKLFYYYLILNENKTLFSVKIQIPVCNFLFHIVNLKTNS